MQKREVLKSPRHKKLGVHAGQAITYGEKMSKSDFLNKQEQIITEFHIPWIDYNSEIGKRMNNFPEKSPEILKLILES